MTEFKDMLVYLRKLNKLSQAELARRISVAPTTIASYEQGKRHPSFEIEEALADVFNVDLDTLRGSGGKSSAYTTEELDFLNLFRKANPDLRTAVRATLEAALLSASDHPKPDDKD